MADPKHPKSRDKRMYSTPASDMPHTAGRDFQFFGPGKAPQPQIVRRLTAAGKIKGPPKLTRKGAAPRPVTPQAIHRAGSKPSAVTGGYDAQRRQQKLQDALLKGWGK